MNLRVVMVIALGLVACSTRQLVHDTCDCPSPGDVCVDGVCRATERGCSAGSCGPDHVCDVGEGEDGRCACSPTPGDWDTCAPRCEGDDDCPGILHCDVGRGFCRADEVCLDDAACVAGEHCVDDDWSRLALETLESGASVVVAVGATSHCAVSGPTAIGSACVYDRDCTSGVCVVGDGHEGARGICAQGCVTNAECPSDQRCQSIGDEVICSPQLPMCDDCDGPDVACMRRGGRFECVAACRVGADCDAVDCEVGPGASVCGEASRCHADEFHAADFAACLTYMPCWDADDCASGYQCISVWSEARVCGRGVEG